MAVKRLKRKYYGCARWRHSFGIRRTVEDAAKFRHDLDDDAKKMWTRMEVEDNAKIKNGTPRHGKKGL